MKTKILLVEDNPLTARGLAYLLERENYQVAVATNAKFARALLADDFDLVLLDVSLPDGDGFALAREVAPGIPLIFLTARDNEADVVRGLELGAKDYITKPFRNRELLLRIRNHLPTPKPNGIKIQGAISYDFANGTLQIGDETIELTALERRIFARLFENYGTIVPRECLLDEIWDASGKVVNDNTLSVYIKRLREKLGGAVKIATVKNLGYRLC